MRLNKFNESDVINYQNQWDTAWTILRNHRLTLVTPSASVAFEKILNTSTIFTNIGYKVL